MKAKNKFIKMFNDLPEKARRELVFDFPGRCMSLAVCKLEISNDTKIGKQILIDLGYKDSEPMALFTNLKKENR